MSSPVTYISQAMVKMAAEPELGNAQIFAGAKAKLKEMLGLTEAQPTLEVMDKRLMQKVLNRLLSGAAIGGVAGAAGGGLYNYLKEDRDNMLKHTAIGGIAGALGGGALGGVYALDAPRAVYNETPLGREAPMGLVDYINLISK